MNDVHAPEKVRCPSCGAKNPPEAEWCGQCLKKFQAAPPPPPPAAVLDPAPVESAPPVPGPAEPAAPAATPVALKPGVEHGAFRSTEEGIVWRCSSCESDNRLEEQTCVVCGTSFGEAFKPPAPQKVTRDPGTTAMISLFFPGAGHAYLKMWPQAIARAVVSVWVALMTLFFAVGGPGGGSPMAALYGLIAFALWLVAAHDSFREANDEPRQVLLYGRRFTYLVLALLMMLMGSMFLTAFTNR